MRVAFETFRQRRNVGGYESNGLSGEAAERTLVAAMAERRMLAGRTVIVDVRAEFRRVAEDRLELGGDRRVIRTDKGGRSDRRRRRNGEKLNDEREREISLVNGERNPAASNFARRTCRFLLGPLPSTAIRYFV